MVDVTERNAAQIAYWNDRAAQTWTVFQERLDRAFAGLTARALAKAAVQPGERVLDIGCGCGDTTLALARAAGPGGRVLGVDVSGPMAARARERIAAAGLGQATVVVDDAAAHPFRPDADLLFSRFGVMFFDEPAAAFANLRRAMRPGGRLAFCCWRPLADNPWFSVPLAAARPLLPPEPPSDPLVPGPFAFADPGRVRAVLEEAGWTDVAVEPGDTPIQMAAPGKLDDAVTMAMGVGALARAAMEAPDALRTKLEEVVRAALAPLDGPEGFRLPGAVWLVTARVGDDLV